MNTPFGQCRSNKGVQSLSFTNRLGDLRFGTLRSTQYGGDQTNECTGGDRRYSCLSARFMWRPKGAGEGETVWLPGVMIHDGFHFMVIADLLTC